MDFAAALKILTTVFTFIDGVIEQVAPIVNKFLDKKTSPPSQPMLNPNCQLPHCGTPPYNCPDDQLSPACFERKMAIADSNSRRLMTPLPKTDDDDNEKKEKSSTSMSPSSTIMLVFVGMIALAIIGFLFIRCNQQNNYRRNSNDRKSSTWSL